MRKSESRYPMGWGDAVCVRQVLAAHYRAPLGVDVLDMGYPDKDGEQELIKKLQKHIQEDSGVNYRHILITAGAGHALTTLMNWARAWNNVWQVYFETPHFSHYPHIASAAELDVVTNLEKAESWISLIDSPSNPVGSFRSPPHGASTLPRFTIWDATYNNSVYCPIPIGQTFHHDAAVGSFGKLFGINGVRLGWIATNDVKIYESLSKYLYFTTLGISVPSQHLINDIMLTIDVRQFMASARAAIDDNRTEVAKLDYLTESISTDGRGMFFWAHMDQKAQTLLRLAGVEWVSGDKCGYTDGWVRLNLAQDRGLVKRMVRDILKIDGK